MKVSKKSAQSPVSWSDNSTTYGDRQNGTSRAPTRGMRARHITVSKQQGMITELELMGKGFGPGEPYMLRYHKSATDSANALDFGGEDPRLVLWTGFRYRNDEVSVVLQRLEPSFNLD